MKNIPAAFKIILYAANIAIFAYLWVCVLFFGVYLANGWLVPNAYEVIFHQDSIVSGIVTRVILYGVGILEIFVLLAILFLINYGLLRLFSAENALKIAKSIFVIEASVGGLLLIVLAFVSK